MKKYEKIDKEIFTKELKATPIAELFTVEKTLPVCFFYRLPEMIRIGFELIYGDIFSDEDLQFIYRFKNRGDKFMKNISPEKFQWIIKHTDDVDYFSFYEYFEILQPTIETIINGNDLYNQYPEYLI